MSQYQAQAERGDMRAAATLASMYRVGEQTLHIAPDYGRAREWYAYAAQGGSANAAYNLAAFYLNGLGVPRDRDRAHALMLWAAQHGDAASVRSLELEGYDMRAERAKLDAQARAYAQSQQSIGNHSNSDDAAAGAAILLGLLMLSAISNSVGHPADEDPRCRAWRQSQLVGAPAGATLPAGFSPASCH